MTSIQSSSADELAKPYLRSLRREGGGLSPCAEGAREKGTCERTTDRLARKRGCRVTSGRRVSLARRTCRNGAGFAVDAWRTKETRARWCSIAREVEPCRRITCPGPGLHTHASSEAMHCLRARVARHVAVIDYVWVSALRDLHGPWQGSLSRAQLHARRSTFPPPCAASPAAARPSPSGRRMCGPGRGRRRGGRGRRCRPCRPARPRAGWAAR